MDRMTLSVVVAAALLSAAPAAMAAKPRKEPPGKEAPKPDVKLTGKVAKVGEAAMTLELAQGESRTLVLLADTKIIKQEGDKTKEAAKADLKAGQEVTVTCSEDGKNALRIVIQDKKGT
jgi:hypothetical protein